jgi:hypothetical protein
VKELWHILGMVQYYRDMWTKRSEMLTPLSDLVGECRETKTTRKNKVKKKPWHWGSIYQIAFYSKFYHRKRGSAGLSMLFEAL